MLIPKILHQTWKDEHIPEWFGGYCESWKKHHPGWRYMLWTDETSRAFIEEHYGWFLDTYDGYPFAIQRADAIRCFMLLHYGGIYVDIDCECFKPIDGLVEASRCFLALEPTVHAQRFNMPHLPSNAMMGAVPGHPFFQATTRDMLAYRSSYTAGWKIILDTTGPWMLQRVRKTFAGRESIDMLPAHLCQPLIAQEAESYVLGMGEPQIVQKLRTAYCVHYFWGTWWKGRDDVG